MPLLLQISRNVRLTRMSLPLRWPSTAKGDYSGLFKDVASAIRNGTPQAVKWEESAEVIEIIELAHKSSRVGKTIEL